MMPPHMTSPECNYYTRVNQQQSHTHVTKQTLWKFLEKPALKTQATEIFGTEISETL